jgi:hypothetical protein
MGAGDADEHLTAKRYPELNPQAFMYRSSPIDIVRGTGQQRLGVGCWGRGRGRSCRRSRRSCPIHDGDAVADVPDHRGNRANR